MNAIANVDARVRDVFMEWDKEQARIEIQRKLEEKRAQVALAGRWVRAMFRYKRDAKTDLFQARRLILLASGVAFGRNVLTEAFSTEIVCAHYGYIRPRDGRSRQRVIINVQIRSPKCLAKVIAKHSAPTSAYHAKIRYLNTCDWSAFPATDRKIWELHSCLAYSPFDIAVQTHVTHPIVRQVISKHMAHAGLFRRDKRR